MKSLLQKNCCFARVRRGRWLSDKEESAEVYAEKMTRLWTTKILGRYLQERYAIEVGIFLDWIQSRIGIRLPLVFFLDEIETFLPIGYLFGLWLQELTKNPGKAESRLSFA